MWRSPNSQGSQDDGLTLGQLSKQLQIMEETHMSIGFTNALPMELTNVGSDTQLSYQMVKCPECSMQMERIGTKTRSSHGIPQKENYKAPSHQDQECVEVRPESGQNRQKNSVLKKSLQSQEVYVVDLNPKIMGRFMSM